jgi:prepilin-type N-terminal cleavage/methylation domain-containing protein
MKMKRVYRHFAKGLTLIEVMISLIIILIIVIGVVSYMYASMWNARRAEVRITATRVGQLLLETWKITGQVNQGIWDVTAFNPITDFGPELPNNFQAAAVDLGGIGVELGDYQIQIDGVYYFVTLLYNNSQPRMLNARVAWNIDLASATLGSDYKYIDLTSNAIY